MLPYLSYMHEYHSQHRVVTIATLPLRFSWRSTYSSGTFYVAFRDLGQILIIRDCPGDSRTVGAYAIRGNKNQVHQEQLSHTLQLQTIDFLSRSWMLTSYWSKVWSLSILPVSHPSCKAGVLWRNPHVTIVGNDVTRELPPLFTINVAMETVHHTGE